MVKSDFMKDILIKIVKCLLPLLGIAMFDSCRVEYGCPYSDFEAKGTVADEEGKGIQGIRVVISAEHPNTNYIGKPLTDTLWTNHDGEYATHHGQFANMNSIKIECEDVDGPENGGEYQKVEIEVPVFKVKEGDGNWYHGAYETGADITMIKK